MFFLQVFSRCACRRSLPAGAGLPLVPGCFFYLTEVFSFARERVIFFAGFFAMCVQARSVCWRRLAPQAGAGPSFLDEKKGSKDSPRGEFRFSPPWNPHSTTKGAAFGNREKLPLWFLLTHRHSLRVKRVCKESFHACNWYGKCSQANKKMRRSRIPHKTAS